MVYTLPKKDGAGSKKEGELVKIRKGEGDRDIYMLQHLLESKNAFYENDDVLFVGAHQRRIFEGEELRDFVLVLSAEFVF